MEHARDFLLGSCLQAAADRGPNAGRWPDGLLQDTWALYNRLTHPAVKLSGSATVSRNGHVRQSWQFDSLPKELPMPDFTMDDTYTITCNPEDDHGDATPDQITYTGDDGGAVVTLAPSADTHSCVATPVAEGTSNVTVADPSSSLAPVTVTLNVGPGPTSQLVVGGQVNVGANAAPPAGP